MKQFTLFAASALCASVALAAPARTSAKVAAKPAAKVAAKPAAKPAAKITVKAPVAKTAPTQVAQAVSNSNAAPGFFPDVPRDHWAFAAVQRLAEAGIIEGYPAQPGVLAEAPTAAARVADADAAAPQTSAPEATKVAAVTPDNAEKPAR